MRNSWLALVLLNVLALSIAHAGPKKEPVVSEKDEKAREFVKQAMVHYSLGKFKEAAEEYQGAFELHPDPALLYNIAQCFRLDGNIERAAFFYRSYLRNNPSARNREEVEGRIADMERLIADKNNTQQKPPNTPLGKEGEAVQPPPPHEATTTTTPPPPSEGGATTATTSPAATSTTPSDSAPTPVYKKWWLWTVIVGVVVVGAVAIGLGVGLSSSSSSGGSHFSTNLPDSGPGATLVRF